MRNIIRRPRRPRWMTPGATRPFESLLRERLPDWELAPWEEELPGITNVDLYSENGALVLEAELPGAKPEDIDLTVDQHSVSLTASRSESHEDSDKDYFIRETRRGTVSRSIPLPQPVNTDDAQAKFDDGVLRVTMPTQHEETKRQVEVQ